MKRKRFEEYTLDEILALNDKSIYRKYLEEIESFNHDRLSREIVNCMKGYSLYSIYEAVIEKSESVRSTYFFPGDQVLFYKGVKERRAKYPITCDFSGGIISKNSLYINYRPLLENIDKKKVYVLKRTIKVEYGYANYLPTNILELETLQQNITLEKELDDTIVYSHLKSQIGGELQFLELRKKRK